MRARAHIQEERDKLLGDKTGGLRRRSRRRSQTMSQLHKGGGASMRMTGGNAPTVRASQRMTAKVGKAVWGATERALDLGGHMVSGRASAPRGANVSFAEERERSRSATMLQARIRGRNQRRRSQQMAEENLREAKPSSKDKKSLHSKSAPSSVDEESHRSATKVQARIRGRNARRRSEQMKAGGIFPASY